MLFIVIKNASAKCAVAFNNNVQNENKIYPHLQRDMHNIKAVSKFNGLIQNSSVDKAKITRSITNKSTHSFTDAVTPPPLPLHCLFYFASPIKALQRSRFSEFIAWIVSLT